MIVKSLQVGEIGTNCYLLGDEATKLGAVIDPGGHPQRILAAVKELGLSIQFILLTHAHFDHTMGVPALVEALGVPVYVHPDEIFDPALRVPQKEYFMYTPPAGSVTRTYGEGDVLKLGGLTIEVLFTPGHSRGSVTLKVGDALFTGDTLFRDSCGRTDFFGGSYETILRSLRRLYDLPGDYQVYPGHEGSSTLARERQRNYFMLEAKNLA